MSNSKGRPKTLDPAQTPQLKPYTSPALITYDKPDREPWARPHHRDLPMGRTQAGAGSKSDKTNTKS